jgi:hypothetical protein
MKVIKLDRRYAGFPKWQYAIQFNGGKKHANLQRLKYANGFQKLYGPDRQINPNKAVSLFSPDWYLYNDNWRNDPKRQRIYIKSESDLSAVLLVMA